MHYHFRLAFLVMSILFFTGVDTTGQQTTPDYTSRVPKFIFGNTLSEQQEQLKTNPLVVRMKESREKLAVEKYRPVYHFVSPEGNQNDPNGLCYWQGQWHLFYQAYPPEDPRQHWGHAISEDLIHWKDLPYAIYPNPEYQCYSGSTFAEEERVIAMYHGTRVGNMVAVSSDPLLLNWKKVAGKAVIPMKSMTGFSQTVNNVLPCEFIPAEMTVRAFQYCPEAKMQCFYH